MNGLQINNILKKNLGGVFKGVYALDQIANLKPSVPAAYVFNTDPIRAPGEHWVAVYITSSRKAVYFDSFGFQPQHTQIVTFLKKTLDKVDFLKKNDSKSFYSGVWRTLCCFFVSFSSF